MSVLSVSRAAYLWDVARLIGSAIVRGEYAFGIRECRTLRLERLCKLLYFNDIVHV